MNTPYTYKNAIAKKCISKTAYRRMLDDFFAEKTLDETIAIVGNISSKFAVSHASHHVGSVIHTQAKPLFEEFFRNFLNTGQIVPT